ncbi:MAG: amidohydrolase [candidate division KSB1 bacterium]|nr:amidohydrolase [candidate division KSB1 bacterium]
MFIDSHVHLDGLTEAYWRLADYYGVRKLLVSHLGMGEEDFSYDPGEHQVSRWNSAVLRACAGRPGRVEGICYANPRHGASAVEEVRRCLRAGMIGVKLWVSVRFDDARVYGVVRIAAAAGVPVLLHAWRKSIGQLENESTPDEVAHLARRFPEARFIMAHSGGDWSYGLRAVESLSSVWVDVACSVIDEGFLETAVARLGPKRILWGTDAPASALPIAVGKLRAAQLPRWVKARIAWKNAAELFALRV